jgi:hypothetical protein
VKNTANAIATAIANATAITTATAIATAIAKGGAQKTKSPPPPHCRFHAVPQTHPQTHP